MTVLIDARPPGLDLLFRPGEDLTVQLVWPAGVLAGRMFEAGLDAAVLAVEVVGDAMTVTATAVQTAAAGPSGKFVLLETTGGVDRDVIVGQWSPSLAAAVTHTATVTVTDGEATVAVTVNGVAAGARLGLVKHLWSQDGWAPFTEVVATADSPQAFTLSVPSGDDQEPRGRWTSDPVTANGNHRVWYLRDDTKWEDSEIRSVLHRPSAWGSGPTNRPQMGHIHRAVQVDETTWRAWVAWYDIAFGTSGLLINTWLVDGVALTQGSGGTTTSSAGPTIDPGLSAVDRMIRVYASARVDVFDVAQHRVTVSDPRLAGYLPGDIVDVTDGGIAALNGAGKVVQSPAAGLVQLVDTTAGDLAMAFNAATLTPAGVNNRYFPRYFASRLVGDRILVKHWRLTDPEPEWDDLNSGLQTLTPPTAPVPLPAGRGFCGVLAAHAHSGAYAEYGDITFRELAA